MKFIFEPPADTVLLAVSNDSGDYVDVWFRDDFNERPDGSGCRWYCTGDNASYPWADVLAYADEAKCSLIEMAPKPRSAL